MTGKWARMIGSFWHARFLSPKDLVCRAAIIALIYAMVNVAGLREYTSILNGTAGSTEISRGLAAFLGVGYVCAYLAYVLLVPIFLIGAGLVMAWEKWLEHRREPTNGSSAGGARKIAGMKSADETAAGMRRCEFRRCCPGVAHGA